jgi:translocation protein SEC62
LFPWTKYFTMATPGPQPTPQQLAQMHAQFMEEAKRRGLTPQQLQEQQRQQLVAEAAKQGLTLEQYVAQLKMRAMQEHQIRQHQAQHAQAQGQGQQPPQQGQMQQIPVNPNAEKKPEAVAVAKFLRSQDLKTRVCILDGQRRDMFKGTD